MRAAIYQLQQLLSVLSTDGNVDHGVGGGLTKLGKDTDRLSSLCLEDTRIMLRKQPINPSFDTKRGDLPGRKIRYEVTYPLMVVEGLALRDIPTSGSAAYWGEEEMFGGVLYRLQLRVSTEMKDLARMFWQIEFAPTATLQRIQEAVHRDEIGLEAVHVTSRVTLLRQHLLSYFVVPDFSYPDSALSLFVRSPTYNPV